MMPFATINHCLKKYFIVFFPFVFFGLLSCSDDPDTAEPIYVAARTDTHTILYSIDPPGTEVKQLAEFEHINEAVRSGNLLYLHAYPYDSLRNFAISYDLSSGVTKRNQYSVYSRHYDRTAIHYSGGQLLISPAGPIMTESFIRILNSETLHETDSISMDTNEQIHSMLVSDNKLFVNRLNNIRVLDFNTWEEVKTIIPFAPGTPLSSHIQSEFVYNSPTEILIYDGGVKKLLPSDLTIATIKRQEEATIKPAYNSRTQLLYVVANTPSGGLSVRTFNTANQEEHELISADKVSMVINAISYHPPRNIIILGGRKTGTPNGVVKIFTTEGELIKEYDINGQVGWIF